MYSIVYCLGLCKYKFAQRRNRLTTHFSERIPVVKRHISVNDMQHATFACIENLQEDHY